MIQFGWRRFSTGISRLLHETAIWFPPPGKLNGSGYTVLIQGACHTQFSPFGYKSISQGSFNEPGSQLPVSAWSLSIKSSIYIQPHHFIPDLLYYQSHLTRLTHNYCHLLPSLHNFPSNLHSMNPQIQLPHLILSIHVIFIQQDYLSFGLSFCRMVPGPFYINPSFHDCH